VLDGTNDVERKERVREMTVELSAARRTDGRAGSDWALGTALTND